MYVKSEGSLLKHLDFLLIDILCLQVSFIVSYGVRHGWHTLPYQNREYLIFIILLSGTGILVSKLMHTYSEILRRGIWKELVAVIKQTVVSVGIIVLLLFLFKAGDSFSRTTLILMPILYILLAWLLHIVWKKHVNSLPAENKAIATMFIADSDKLETALEKAKKNSSSVLIKKVVRTEDIDSGQFTVDDIIREWLDEVLIVSDRMTPQRVEFIKELQKMGIVVHEAIPMDSSDGLKHFYAEAAGYPTITTSVNEATPGQAFIKNCMDICGGVAGALLCIVVLIIIGPIVFFTDPGPVIFSQVRVGKNGKKFKILKIRSMYKDAEKRKSELMNRNNHTDGMLFKVDDDPRILPGIGKFIRKTSLDEFPQFFNVLAGHMSLVGTRPPTVDEWEKYGSRHRLRLAIKPGITGMWQVSGRSEITDFEEVLKLDTKYIYNWSLGLDMKILWETVKISITGRGAK